MPYASPGAVKRSQGASTVVAIVSLLFTALAYVFVLILANQWLLYGQDETKKLIALGIPAALVMALVLAIFSRILPQPNRGLSVLAILAAAGSLLLLVLVLVYALLHFAT